MKKVILLFFTIVISITLVMCSDDNNETETSDCVSVTPTYDYTIVDTNQTLCYDSGDGSVNDGHSVLCSGIGAGQDGAYSGNQPSYTSCNSGTVVVDNNTGLMWQSTTDTDGVSGLTSSDKKTQSVAESYCGNLTYGTYSDWRLPSTKELYSIYLFSGQDISGVANASTNGVDVDVSGYDPFIDTDYFDVGYGDTDDNERKIDGQYATTTLNITQVMSGISSALEDSFFGVNFVDGHIKSYETSANGSDMDYYVRCVRGNTSYGTNDFVDNSDSTISDNATNLIWEKDDSGGTGVADFDDAITLCEGATTGTYTDWRLPNIKELHSILDYSKSPDNTSSPAIDMTYFNSTSFINEAGDTDWGYYWTSSALLDYQGYGNKGAYITFGRGMGYINDITDVHGAGAQRSDYKTTTGRDADAVTTLTATDIHASCTFGQTGYKKGPQGDIIRVDHNFVRCVRDQ